MFFTKKNITKHLFILGFRYILKSQGISGEVRPFREEVDNQIFKVPMTTPHRFDPKRLNDVMMGHSNLKNQGEIIRMSPIEVENRGPR